MFVNNECYMVTIPTSDDKVYHFERFEHVEESIRQTWSRSSVKPTLVRTAEGWDINLEGYVIGTVKKMSSIRVYTEPTHF